MNYKAILTSVAFVAFFGNARGADMTTVSERTTKVNDPVKIAKVLAAIPTIRGSLADLLTQARLKPIELRITRLNSEDVAYERPQYHLRPGDTAIQILLGGTNDSIIKVAGCELWSSPTILKHGSTYFPDDKSSNWLLTGRCIAP